MTASTHFAFSYLLTSAAGATYPVALASSLLSLAPDIDHPKSLVGRLIPGLSKYLIKKYGHRTITHSIFSVLTVAICLSPALFISKTFYFCSILAYSSHIFIDLFNTSGVKIFAPYSVKEYISFRTPALRITVSSWKEYLVLFIIVLLAFSVSGRAFSITSAVRSAAKMIYKNYGTAIDEFQDFSGHICKVKITHYDNLKRIKVHDVLVVLNIFPEKIYLLKDGDRIIIRKVDVIDIELIKTDIILKSNLYEGKDLLALKEIPNGSFVTGTVSIKNYKPDFRNTDFLKSSHSITGSEIEIIYASPDEIVDLINLEDKRNKEIQALELELSSYQIERLTIENEKLQKEIQSLKSSGFYNNYSQIIRLDTERKKILSRIDTLKIKQSTGSDEIITNKINKLKEGIDVSYKIYSYKF